MKFLMVISAMLMIGCTSQTVSGVTPGPIAQNLPEQVQREIAELNSRCQATGGQVRPTASFLTEVDVNGDGRVDYIVDGAQLGCTRKIWANNGAPLAVFVSQGGNAVLPPFRQLTSGVNIERGTKPARVDVRVSDALCNGDGKREVCTRSLVWDSQRKSMGLNYVPPQITSNKRPAPQLLSDQVVQAVVGRQAPKQLGEAILVDGHMETRPGVFLYWWAKPYKNSELYAVRAFATADSKGRVLAIQQVSAEHQKTAAEVIACNRHGTSDNERFWIGVNSNHAVMALYSVDRAGAFKLVPKPYSKWNCSEM